MSQMDFFCLEKFCSNKIVLHCPSQKWKFWNNLSFSFGYHIFCCQIIRNEICIEINIGIDIFISSTGHITYSSLKRSWTFLKEFSGSSLCTDSVLVFSRMDLGKSDFSTHFVNYNIFLTNWDHSNTFWGK